MQYPLENQRHLERAHRITIEQREHRVGELRCSREVRTGIRTSLDRLD